VVDRNRTEPMRKMWKQETDEDMADRSRLQKIADENEEEGIYTF
jgi:hypothetical protein